MLVADKNKGWTFAFKVFFMTEDENPARAVVVGEVGDVNMNVWDEDEEAMFYMDEEHALGIAKDAVETKYGCPMDLLEWIETAKFHPDHLVGLKQVSQGVWV